MRTHAPFQASDLEELDARLLSRADAVVSIAESIGASVWTVGMRHDVDNVLEPAVAMAEWEAERSYAATYFILHSAPYWSDKDALRTALERIAAGGHEIGFHTNALAEALRTGRDPAEIVHEAVDELRSYGYEVRGVVAHGDPLCHEVPGGFVNDELFAECVRPSYGLPERTLSWNGVEVPIRRRSWAEFGFRYDPNWLSRALEFSDSGGQWHSNFDDVVAAFPYPNGQVQILAHPCWWAEAFVEESVAA